MTTEPRPPHFVDERHALYVGWILGIAMRNGIDARPGIDDDGNYTDRLTVVLGDRTGMLPVTVEFIVPPPPADWAFDTEDA